MRKIVNVSINKEVHEDFTKLCKENGFRAMFMATRLFEQAIIKWREEEKTKIKRR